MTSEPPNKPTRSTEPAEPESPPPVFGTWRRFYVIVVLNTLFVYLLLLLFSRYAR